MEIIWSALHWHDATIYLVTFLLIWFTSAGTLLSLYFLVNSSYPKMWIHLETGEHGFLWAELPKEEWQETRSCWNAISSQGLPKLRLQVKVMDCKLSYWCPFLYQHVPSSFKESQRKLTFVYVRKFSSTTVGLISHDVQNC